MVFDSDAAAAASLDDLRRAAYDCPTESIVVADLPCGPPGRTPGGRCVRINPYEKQFLREQSEDPVIRRSDDETDISNAFVIDGTPAVGGTPTADGPRAGDGDRDGTRRGDTDPIRWFLSSPISPLKQS